VKQEWNDLPVFEVSIAAMAELALEASAGFAEKESMTLEALMMRDDSEIADAMAAGVDIVVMGFTNPVESVVPVIVLVIGPSGPSVVIVVVMTTGTVN
jgi:hypothetical protein